MTKYLLKGKNLEGDERYMVTIGARGHVIVSRYQAEAIKFTCDTDRDVDRVRLIGVALGFSPIRLTPKKRVSDTSSNVREGQEK